MRKRGDVTWNLREGNTTPFAILALLDGRGWTFLRFLPGIVMTVTLLFIALGISNQNELLMFQRRKRFLTWWIVYVSSEAMSETADYNENWYFNWMICGESSRHDSVNCRLQDF